jgi:hypothetical protein
MTELTSWTRASHTATGVTRHLEGKGHSTLTEHRQQAAVDRVLDFFDERLKRDAS